jgi:hypothetical protein
MSDIELYSSFSRKRSKKRWYFPGDMCSSNLGKVRATPGMRPKKLTRWPCSILLFLEKEAKSIGFYSSEVYRIHRYSIILVLRFTSPEPTREMSLAENKPIGLIVFFFF